MHGKSLKTQRGNLARRDDLLAPRPRTLRSQLRASGFDRLPEPVFLIGPSGLVVDSNLEAKRLVAQLPAEGHAGSVGRRELVDIFVRAGSQNVAPLPLRIETAEGSRHYEARFAPGARGGTKAVVLADVTVWKRALAEKDAILHVFKSEIEKPVAVCARCGSLKDRDGNWGLPGGIDRKPIPAERLSHGLCQACLQAELGNLGLSSLEAESLAIGNRRV